MSTQGRCLHLCENLAGQPLAQTVRITARVNFRCFEIVDIEHIVDTLLTLLTLHTSPNFNSVSRSDLLPVKAVVNQAPSLIHIGSGELVTTTESSLSLLLLLLLSTIPHPYRVRRACLTQR